MTRRIYLGVLTLAGGIAMATSFEARQERARLVVHDAGADGQSGRAVGGRGRVVLSRTESVHCGASAHPRR